LTISYLNHSLLVGISCFYHDMDEEGQPNTVEYFGRVQSIIQLYFTSFKVTLLKGKWYDSKSPFKTRPNLLLDDVASYVIGQVPTFPLI
jgi:hypothetical protein